MASANNKLALQCHHDDKLVRYGLSGLKSHWNRLQITFSGNPNNNSTPANSNWVVPDLSPYFSNTIFWDYSDSFKGFYKVFSDIFDQVYENELSFAEKRGLGVDNSVEEAPMMGNYDDSPYAQVEEFYDYWLRFSTVMDYCWVDKYDPNTAEELTRKSRRVMEKENRKLRKKAQREFNMTVRSLAEFVKKRDQRVIDMLEEKRLEMEKKREVERQREMSRKMERDMKLERAMEYEEPEWARIVEQDHHEEEAAAFEEVERKEELYWCVVCEKKLKSENQWKNHEQSKKHREKAVAPQLRDELDEECKNTGRMEKEQPNTRRLVLDISVIHTVLLIAASLLLYLSLRSFVH